MAEKKGFSVGTKPLFITIFGYKRDYDHLAWKGNQRGEAKQFPTTMAS